MRLVVTSNAQPREIVQFREKNDAFIDALMRMRRLSYLSGGLPGLLVTGSTIVVFLYGGWRVINGSITMGTMVAFSAYQMRLLSPVQGLMGLYASLATAKVSLRRVHEILDAPVEVVEKENADVLSHVMGEVTFNNVTFSFDRGGPVLDAVSVTVRAGETVAIVGPSGGGKSTIADLLVRQLDPNEGHILLDGRDIGAFTLASLRENVVCVEQQPFVFNASIAENVRYARPDATDAEVVAATRAAGLEKFVEGLPERFATQVGEGGKALSSGERQRIAIARAFLVDPAVLVLDEPTAALDAASEAQVIEGYEAIMSGRTTIVISHRLELMRKADRVIVLDRGRVVEEGPPEELLARRGAFYGLVAVE
jgi:ATP-binding cassette subfamily B protein